MKDTFEVSKTIISRKQSFSFQIHKCKSKKIHGEKPIKPLSCTFISTIEQLQVQIFVELYFCEFRESIGDRENKKAKAYTHTVQVCCCRPSFSKLKSQKLLGAGVHKIYVLRKFVHIWYSSVDVNLHTVYLILYILFCMYHCD